MGLEGLGFSESHSVLTWNLGGAIAGRLRVLFRGFVQIVLGSADSRVSQRKRCQLVLGVVKHLLLFRLLTLTKVCPSSESMLKGYGFILLD